MLLSPALGSEGNESERHVTSKDVIRASEGLRRRRGEGERGTIHIGCPEVKEGFPKLKEYIKSNIVEGKCVNFQGGTWTS